MLICVQLCSANLMCFMFPFSRDTANPVTALQGELEEGHRCPRAGENRQAEHPFQAHRLPFLQLSCRHGRQEQAGGTLAAGLAEPSVVCLKPSAAIDRTTFPESPLTVLFHLLRGLLEKISKALGRPCLSFCWGRGPVLALWNFALTLAFPGPSCPLFTDLPQKDSRERLFWEYRGRPSRAGAQGTAVDFHMSGRSRGAVPSLIHSALCSPGGVQKDSLSHRATVGLWEVRS